MALVRTLDEAQKLCKEADELLQEDASLEALNKATAALALFAEAKDSRGTAEATRFLILAIRNEAEQAGVKPVESDRRADDELSAARAASDRFAEAVYLLVLAECNSDRRGSKRRERALVWAFESLALFQEIGDKEFEVTVLLEIANIFYKQKIPHEIARHAQEALDIARELGDKKLEALAIHGIALSFVVGPDKKIDLGIAKAKEAAAVFRSLGLRRLEATSLRAIANWHLASDKPKKALPVAEESMRICRELPNGEVREANSLISFIDALMSKKQYKDALEAARDARERFRTVGKVECEVAALQLQANALMADRQPEEAIATLEEGLRLLQDGPDRRLEFDFLTVTAKAYQDLKRMDEAAEKLREAAALARQLGEPKREAEALRNAGNLYLTVGDVEKALSLARDARDLSRKTGSGERGEGIALAIMASCKASKGEELEAISLATEAAEIFSACKDLRRECQLWTMLSELHQRRASQGGERGKVDAKSALYALEASEKSLELRRETGDKILEGEGLLQLAGLYLVSEDAQEAERLAKEAQKIFHKVGEANGEISAHIMLCQMYVAAYASVANAKKKSVGVNSNLQKAMTHANEGLVLAKKSGDKMARGWCSYWRAQVLTWSRNFDQALKTAQDTQGVFQSVPSDEGESHVLALIADLYIIFGNDSKAQESAEQALTLARACKDVQGERLALDALERIEKRRQEQKAKAGSQVQQVQQVQQAQEIQQEQQQALPAGSAAPPAKQGLDPVLAKEKLMTLVKDVIASDDELEQDSPFMEAGMDSLSSVQLMTEVSKTFQLSLSPSLIFDFPNVRSMVDHLVEESKAY